MLQPVSVAVEWFNESLGFAVKVQGRPVFASKNSIRADGVAEFLTNNPELARAISTPPGQ